MKFKKFVLTICITLLALTTSGCSMVLSGQQYDYEGAYNEDYAYLDDYAQVDWNSAQYDMEYSYYDINKVFLVVYGGKIFVIPYDYFYRYVYPRFRMRIIWRSYDYFCGIWGHNYYNNLWSRYHYRHYRSNWRPHYNWYDNHKRRNNNRPFVIRKDQLRRQIQPQPRYFAPKNNAPRFYVPKKYNHNNRAQNYNYVPRNQRQFVPRSDYPRSFRTPSNTPSHRPSFTPPNSGTRKSTPPPIIVKKHKR